MKRLILFLICIIVLTNVIAKDLTDSEKIDKIFQKLESLNLQKEIIVHGTEYFKLNNESIKAKAWLQLINSTGQNIDNGYCTIDIYTPDNQEFIESAGMTNFFHDGLYYYETFMPDQSGVYPMIAECFYTAIDTPYYPSAYQILRGTYVSGLITDVTIIDGTELKIKENTPNPRKITAAFNITSNCQAVSPNLLTGIEIKLTGKFDSVLNDNIRISIYNFTSNSYNHLNNYLIEGPGVNSVSNFISLNNITKSGYYKTGLGSIILLNDTSLTDGGDDQLEIDYLSLDCIQLSNPVYQQIKGNGEIHITDLRNLTFFYVADPFNYSKLDNLFNYSQVQCPNITINLGNTSINLTIDTQGINQSLINISQQQAESKRGVNMIAFIILFIVSLLLYIFITNNIVIDIFNILIDLSLIYMFAINNLLIFVWLSLALAILSVIRVYNNKESGTA